MSASKKAPPPKLLSTATAKKPVTAKVPAPPDVPPPEKKPEPGFWIKFVDLFKPKGVA